MASRTITISSNGRNITVAPTRQWFQSAQNDQTVRWNPAGPDVEIVKIEFDSPNAPVSNIHKISGTNDWQGTNNTNVEGDWKYTVTLMVNGEQLTPLDPELKNGPPTAGDWS